MPVGTYRLQSPGFPKIVYVESLKLFVLFLFSASSVAIAGSEKERRRKKKEGGRQGHTRFCNCNHRHHEDISKATNYLSVVSSEQGTNPRA